jgi:hypothetical protein
MAWIDVEYALRVLGAATLLGLTIGMLCLLKFLVEEVARTIVCKTFREVLLNGWRPVPEFKHEWRTEWWWTKEQLLIEYKEVTSGGVNVQRTVPEQVRGDRQ